MNSVILTGCDPRPRKKKGPCLERRLRLPTAGVIPGHSQSMPWKFPLSSPWKTCFSMFKIRCTRWTVYAKRNNSILKNSEYQITSTFSKQLVRRKLWSLCSSGAIPTPTKWYQLYLQTCCITLQPKMQYLILAEPPILHSGYKEGKLDEEVKSH